MANRAKASRISFSWSAVMLFSLASFEARFFGAVAAAVAALPAAALLRLGGWMWVLEDCLWYLFWETHHSWNGHHFTRHNSRKMKVVEDAID
jgi:hypothetical protein